MTDPQQFLIYQSEDGFTRIGVMLEAETLWLNQKQLTELFGKAKGTISEHIKHIFEDGELDENAVVRLFRTTAADGKQYEVAHYNLDMVLALGFRVRSPVDVRFRQWANDKLKEYIVKGFVLDDARLKNPGKGRDYFDELTRRLQDIRTSKRRFYQKITDIYSTSVDYDSNHPLTQEFFATVQNKVHYAIHGQTAAELIATRADSSQPNMGLTTWEGARIRKADVSIAKNYLAGMVSRHPYNEFAMPAPSHQSSPASGRGGKRIAARISRYTRKSCAPSIIWRSSIWFLPKVRRCVVLP